MIPTSSNTADKGCSPTSSNCVIWQGPDLPCISLCSGDTISSVVYKVATKLCSIQSTYDLSSLDLSCLVSFCSASNPAPTTKTLLAVLDFIVKKVCCINGKVDAIQPGNSYVEPTLNLPTCLQYTNGQGQLVTTLLHSNFTLTLGTKFCELKAVVDGHTGQISSLGNRVTALENAGGYTPPLVTPNCILTPGTPTAMNTFLDELENQYCQLKTVLGSNAALTTAIGQQCNIGSANALSKAGTMSSAYAGSWNNVTTNVAQSLQNMWVTICDMRSAIYDLKNTSTQVDCSAFLLAFTAACNVDRTQVTVFFNGGGTVVPAGFTNCNAQGSKITITDGIGHIYTAYVDLTTAVSDVDGITYTVTGAALNASQPYLITVEGCLSKSGTVCSKTATYTVSVPCPVITGISATLT